MKKFVDENNYPLFDGLIGLKQITMKTAVEWFMDKIAEKQPNGLYVIDTLEDVQNVFEQAKAIEKEQIIQAVDDNDSYTASGIVYYEEKYKNK
jgi:hypothetical protein